MGRIGTRVQQSPRWTENHDGSRVHSWRCSVCNLSALLRAARAAGSRDRHENILRRGAISLLFRMRPESSLPVTKTSSQKESLKLEHHRAPCLFAAALTTSQHGRACRDSWSGRFRSNLRRRSCRARIPDHDFREGNRAANNVRCRSRDLVSVRRAACRESDSLGARNLPCAGRSCSRSRKWRLND